MSHKNHGKKEHFSLVYWYKIQSLNVNTVRT